MMNNYTPHAQHVLALARKEADRFNHNYVGTEHILLGIIKLNLGVAVTVLQKMGLDLDTIRTNVEKQVRGGPEEKMPGGIPYTPRVKKVLVLAGKEAGVLNHNYVGTEHILLGLLLEGEGVAARVLKSLEVDIERTRNEILKGPDPKFTPSEGDRDQPKALSILVNDVLELLKKPVLGVSELIAFEAPLGLAEYIPGHVGRIKIGFPPVLAACLQVLAEKQYRLDAEAVITLHGLVKEKWKPEDLLHRCPIPEGSKGKGSIHNQPNS